MVLDERDYKNLIEESKKCKTLPPKEPSPEPVAESPKEPADLPAIPPEAPKDSPAPEESEEPVEPHKTPPQREAPVEEDSPEVPPPPKELKSELEEVLEKVPRVAHQDALDLLDRLSKLTSFEQRSGEICLDGRLVENYTLQRFLVATCDKRAEDDIPVPLRLFLRKNGIRKFRNKKIKLRPLKPWENLYD